MKAQHTPQARRSGLTVCGAITAMAAIAASIQFLDCSIYRQRRRGFRWPRYIVPIPIGARTRSPTHCFAAPMRRTSGLQTERKQSITSTTVEVIAQHGC
ncbi:hypothetical protein XU06_30265 (plasmid) [Rhodococcus erythropolis]|nr:hypothetical protein XU06_30265 [Rhodococcus erythropolis]